MHEISTMTQCRVIDVKAELVTPLLCKYCWTSSFAQGFLSKL